MPGAVLKDGVAIANPERSVEAEAREALGKGRMHGHGRLLSAGRDQRRDGRKESEIEGG